MLKSLRKTGSKLRHEKPKRVTFHTPGHEYKHNEKVDIIERQGGVTPANVVFFAKLKKRRAKAKRSHVSRKKNQR